MKIKFILSTILFALLLGCEKKNSTLINLTNLRPTDGFIDVPLSIVDTEELTDYFQYDARAILDKDTIGILVKLKKNIPAGIVNGEPKNMFLQDGIEFISNGAQSDSEQLFYGTAHRDMPPRCCAFLERLMLFTRFRVPIKM